MFRRILFGVIYVLVVAGLVIAIILSFNHKTSAPGNPATVSENKAGSPSTSKENQNKALNTNNSTVNVNPSNPSNSSSSSTKSNNQSKLSNTGPGNVIALFILTSLIAGLIHFKINHHKRYT